MSKLPEGFNPEQKEEEKKSPIFIIYRDNDLFQKQIPEMVKILSAMGRQVEVQGFPKESTAEEIKKWYEENQSRLEGKEIVSDWTASIPYKMREDLSSKGTKQSKSSLDGLFNEATEKAVLGEKYDELSYEKAYKEWSEDRSREFYSIVVKRILENPENIPEKVFVFLDSILDHTYVENVKEAAKAAREGKLEKNEKKEAEKIVAEKLREWLIEGGIDSNKIILEYDNSFKNLSHSSDGKKIIEEIDKLNNWVIVDRHCGGGPEVKSAKGLKLPENTFYQTANNGELIKVKDEEFAEALSNVLEKKFSDKKESRTEEI